MGAEYSSRLMNALSALEDARDQIDDQILALEEVARTQYIPTSAQLLRDKEGNHLMTPLVVAKAGVVVQIAKVQLAIEAL